MSAAEDPAILWAPEAPWPHLESLPLPPESSHRLIHRADAAYQFLHESIITSHGGKIVIAWNNSPGAESEPGTVVRWLESDEDFLQPTAPAVLAPPLEHPTTIWESCQLLSTRGELWAFVGQVHTQPRRPAESGGRMVIFRLDESARHWIEQGTVDGFHPLNPPRRTAAGHWIIGGQFNLVQPRVALSRGDDLRHWEVVEIPSAPTDRINYAETALIAQGETLTAFVRSETPAVFTAASRDHGRTWSPLRRSNLPMSSAKLGAGVLSTGQRFLAFNLRPDNPGASERDALAVAVSAPGETLFRKLVLVRLGRSPTPCTTGYAKEPQWSYPSVFENAGRVHVTYSVTKEDCGLTTLPLAAFAL